MIVNTGSRHLLATKTLRRFRDAIARAVLRSLHDKKLNFVGSSRVGSEFSAPRMSTLVSFVLVLLKTAPNQSEVGIGQLVLKDQKQHSCLLQHCPLPPAQSLSEGFINFGYESNVHCDASISNNTDLGLLPCNISASSGCWFTAAKFTKHIFYLYRSITSA